MKILICIFSIFILCACNKNKIDSHSNSETEISTESFSGTDFSSFIGNDYLIDDQHSYLGFKIKYFGYSPVRGRFNDFDGTLFYNPSDPSSLSVTVFVEANSINTGNETRDNDLKREGSWFDVKTYPIISFSSSEVIPKPNGEFDLVGTLTIKGISKVDTIAFQKPTELSKDWAGNDQVDFTGRTIINRQDFNVFGGDFWSSIMENGLTQLSDEVEIEIDIHARKADYQARYEDADSLDINKIALDHIKSNGMDAGLNYIDSLFQNEQLTAGKLSSIGYTLNNWKMHEEALVVFNKRLEYYPNKTTTWNQLGITNLFLKNDPEAKENFKTILAADSTDSRSHEYIRLINLLH